MGFWNNRVWSEFGYRILCEVLKVRCLDFGEDNKGFSFCYWENWPPPVSFSLDKKEEGATWLVAALGGCSEVEAAMERSQAAAIVAAG